MSRRCAKRIATSHQATWRRGRRGGLDKGGMKGDAKIVGVTRRDRKRRDGGFFAGAALAWLK
jgi:hypothetical protein